MKQKLKVNKFRLPAYWASYLINGDHSGMDDAEKTACDNWLATVKPGSPASCEDYHEFSRSHDAFSFWPYAGATEEFCFLS